MPRYHGKTGRLYASVSGTGNAIPVLSLNDWTLDMATDKVETTSFEDTNKTWVQGNKDIAGTFAGFWDTAEDTLFTGADSADGVKLYLYPATTAITKYWYGPAWIDVSLAVGTGDSAKISGTFSANGSWARKP